MIRINVKSNSKVKVALFANEIFPGGKQTLLIVSF